ncbi:hypothetical protein HBI56_096580 [Parastagonospora nodorum]|uniref:Uncharacterized protein n=1 Tax=Phaeosphaeria nodorum (strain SN15 / ATCC MYA-4574 / FGSC 10173) TaxID=321614 RepID=A0A7U2F8H6_PHANO|nr:hypothetical protein HBH56_091960 [Parastagonospora nodorum]QRC98344.1 hypothetical protein JI435_411920 [Parastagonospora nodorum SN15]KAH3936684.1 hypothetical protein HBH54_026600 [Parastagonospora nodorum]KAH3940443.1 hypothetical protein HBH53_216700 [Parastagonospora nodorum]KAH3957716.1 hypothetical protein HBH51_221500 [Parastagonospora nodorum]
MQSCLIGAQHNSNCAIACQPLAFRLGFCFPQNTPRPWLFVRQTCIPKDQYACAYVVLGSTATVLVPVYFLPGGKARR